MQRLTEYIGESVSMKKRIGIGRLQKSRASQINYIEGVYHGIVRSVLKVEGHEWTFCDDESNVSFGKERCCFRGVLTMDSPYLNKDVRLPFWQRRCDQIHLGSNIGVDGLLTC